jgi:hypothetical protein
MSLSQTKLQELPNLCVDDMSVNFDAAINLVTNLNGGTNWLHVVIAQLLHPISS